VDRIDKELQDLMASTPPTHHLDPDDVLVVHLRRSTWESWVYIGCVVLFFWILGDNRG
jgi:hypothetical protein